VRSADLTAMAFLETARSEQGRAVRGGAPGTKPASNQPTGNPPRLRGRHVGRCRGVWWHSTFPRAPAGLDHDVTGWKRLDILKPISARRNMPEGRFRSGRRTVRIPTKQAGVPDE
jgi:hypothetical protein